MSTLIEIKNVSKKFGRFVALDDVSLDIEAGEAVALWGPNGAGKSTLIRCLLGLLPFTGSAQVSGLDVRRNGKSARALIGYVPQEPALFDDLRVAEVATLFARVKNASAAEAKEMLVECGLAAHARKRVRELSGGMKQRLSLGLALLTNPPILLLDEPTSNLDESARQELLQEVDQLRNSGKTLLLISHRPEEVRRIADRVITMESGRIVRVDSTSKEDRPSDGSPLLVDRTRIQDALRALRDAGIEVRPGAGAASNNGHTAGKRVQ